MITIFVNGMAVGAGLIVAIGSQNAFVLSQGLRRQHHLLVAGICMLCDALLIGAGVLGMGQLITQHPALLQLAKWGGGLFLLWMGGRSVYQMLKPRSLQSMNQRQQSRRTVVLATLAVTLLNPHVYLDTVLMIGSIGAQFGTQRGLFAAGAISASIVWFFGLSLAAARLQPLLARPQAWRVIDGLLGLSLLWIGSRLLCSSPLAG